MFNYNDIAVARFSHIGHRDENQDRCDIFSDPRDGALLVVVADGMGGHKGGALAAETAIKRAAEIWRERNVAQPTEDFLQHLVGACHKAVVAAGKARDITPRATFAALFIQIRGDKTQCVSIHAGDCRVTQYGADGAVKHTMDHSLAWIHVLRGKITPEQAATHPDQSRILMNIGGEQTLDPEITADWDVAQGGRFVVCSDGFWEIFNADDVSRLFRSAVDAEKQGMRSPALEKAISGMFEKKLSRLEKHDNTTAVLIDLGGKAGHTGWVRNTLNTIGRGFKKLR